MGIKKIFKKRDPTEEELVEDLNRAGISTKGSNTRQDKFGAFKVYANERAAQRSALAPVNPYANVQANGNPYAEQNQNQTSSQSQPNQPYQTSSQSQPNQPYQPPPRQNGSPYQQPQNPNQPPPRQNGSPYGQPNAYAPRQRSNPYARGGAPRDGGSRDPAARDDTSVLDLNRMPTNQEFASTKPARRPVVEDLDLNVEEDDLNVDLGDLPEEEVVNSEDEEIEAIKQDIRFVKQESVASTRNTLRMAQEADASAINTMGMLGSQSERLYNAEQNLLLADTQTQIADSKVKELHRLNRSIFVPAAGNPFNKKSRLRQQEEKIKNAKAQEKYMRETNRQEMYASEQRIKQGITATESEVASKYKGERDLAAAQRYQFENDSEDDEMEKELAANLEQIGSFAKKLKNNAKTIGQEVDSQNARLRKIEEDADRLDINVHMNNTRLQNIR